jgi:aspartyl/asparaginyl-tRNA synthetase
VLVLQVTRASVKATTVQTVEIKVTSVFVVQLARMRLAFQPREAERPPPPEDEEVEEGKKKTKVGGRGARAPRRRAGRRHTHGPSLQNILQDMRLDHRTLDLRTPAMQAIARISDAVVRLFSEKLRALGFLEIMTPKLLAGASEGGADVFKTDYFGQVACLAQSPQLHKQLCCACAGFERCVGWQAGWQAGWLAGWR